MTYVCTGEFQSRLGKTLTILSRAFDISLVVLVLAGTALGAALAQLVAADQQARFLGAGIGAILGLVFGLAFCRKSKE